MVKVMGNATTGFAGSTGISLPKPDETARAAHKPWCRECKRKQDGPEDLDDAGLCAKCARVAKVRADAAARRGDAQATAPTRSPRPRSAPATVVQREPAAPQGYHPDDASTPAPSAPASAVVTAEPDDAQAYHLEEVLLTELHPDPDNPRTQLTGIEDLAASIETNGLVQPIVARRHDGRLVVVAGHRRLAALEQLGHTRTEVIVRADMAPDAVLAAMLVENGQRAGLDPIDEARALAHLKRRDDLTDRAVGVAIGRSQMHVSNRLTLLELTPEQQAAVRAGTLSLAAAAKAGRKRGGTTRPGAVGKKSAAHLTEHHPLAAAVADLCSRVRRHKKNTPGRVGGVGCGRCWEDAIRADEASKAGQ